MYEILCQFLPKIDAFCHPESQPIGTKGLGTDGVYQCVESPTLRFFATLQNDNTCLFLYFVVPMNRDGDSLNREIAQL